MAQAESSGIPLQQTRWGLRDVGYTLAGAWLLGFVVAVLFAALAAAGADPGFGVVLLVGATLPWVVLAGWPVVATRRWGNGPTVDLGWQFRGVDVLWGLGGGLTVALLGWLAGLLTESVVGPFDSAAGRAASQLAAEAPAWQVWLFAAVALLGAPVAEELAFRGLLWSGLARAGAGPVATLLGSAGLFALFHFEPVRFGVLLVVGLGLGWLRLRTGRVGAPTIAHAVNNLPGALAILALAS